MYLFIEYINLFENDLIKLLARVSNEKDIKEIEDSGWSLNKKEEASRLIIFNNNLNPNNRYIKCSILCLFSSGNPQIINIKGDQSIPAIEIVSNYYILL